MSDKATWREMTPAGEKKLLKRIPQLNSSGMPVKFVDPK